MSQILYHPVFKMYYFFYNGTESVLYATHKEAINARKELLVS